LVSRCWRRQRSSSPACFAGTVHVCLHTLPFLIPQYRAALVVAVVTIAFELVALAGIRWRFFHTGFHSFASVALGGAIIAGLSAALGAAG
jgi:erythrin-vacuolar iron transport family protein